MSRPDDSRGAAGNATSSSLDDRKLVPVPCHEWTMTITASQLTTLHTDRARQELARVIEQRARTNGRHATAWPGLDFVREEHPRTRTPAIQVPCLCIVARGQKRVYLGGEVFAYDPLHYLVMTMPLLVEGEVITANPAQPYLALRLHLKAEILSDLVLETKGDARRRGNGLPQRGIYVSSLSDALCGTVLRLIAALDDPTERRVLAPLAEREVLYRLLMGEQGERLRAAALRDSHAYRIAEVLRFLQTHYDQRLDIATIADVANMRPSTLHHTFKSVTNATPLQYLKQIRLHQARLLMLHEGLGVGEAAYRVGYRSDAQFSREYRRLFGVAPSRDVSLRREENSPTSHS